MRPLSPLMRSRLRWIAIAAASDQPYMGWRDSVIRALLRRGLIREHRTIVVLSDQVDVVAYAVPATVLWPTPAGMVLIQPEIEGTG